MGWEERGGRMYYYRKRREGQRVISEYIGTGLLAEMMANLDELERSQRAFDRDVARAEKEQDQLIAAEIDQLVDLIRAVTHAALLTAGYHTHKGQWRRKHERQ